MEIKNLEKLIATLRGRAAKALKDSDVSVVVGYTANYAVYVHENMEMKLEGQPRPSGLGNYWGPAGASAKFLEKPARQHASELAEIVRKVYKSGKTLATALLMAGLRLQRESQKMVPREYGHLVSTAFTRVERGEAESGGEQ